MKTHNYRGIILKEVRDNRQIGCLYCYLEAFPQNGENCGKPQKEMTGESMYCVYKMCHFEEIGGESSSPTGV